MKKKNNYLKYRGFFSIHLSTSLGACSLPSLESFSTGIELSPSMLVVAQSVVLVTMVAGLISLLAIVIPGLTIIWISALIYGLLTGFTTISIILFVLITALMLFGNVVDQLLMSAKAKNSGASLFKHFSLNRSCVHIQHPISTLRRINRCHGCVNDHGNHTLERLA